MTAQALEVLARCTFPGNIRQLRNVVRTASAVAGAQPIDVHHLDLGACGAPATSRISAATGVPAAAAITLGDAERQAITQALEAHSGNLVRTARALGIDRGTLRRKILRLKIPIRRT